MLLLLLSCMLQLCTGTGGRWHHEVEIMRIHHFLVRVLAAAAASGMRQAARSTHRSCRLLLLPAGAAFGTADMHRACGSSVGCRKDVCPWLASLLHTVCHGAFRWCWLCLLPGCCSRAALLWLLALAACMLLHWGLLLLLVRQLLRLRRGLLLFTRLTLALPLPSSACVLAALRRVRSLRGQL